MGNLPSGTVTFLFTDIEDSTKLAKSLGDKWESHRARHHAILKAAIESNNGYVFQIIGDAFCASFHTVGDAVRAAAKSQVDLYKEEWGDAPVKVRMGINTGTAQASIDTDHSGGYKGYTTMARVTRLMSAGHGGQVLISAATQELLLNDVPAEVLLRDLGERRLKDLIRPERIYQLVIENLPYEFPPLKTLDAYRHNLPVQLTSFIGREKQIAEIKGSILTHRLVTLTGAGGTGKTRLALQVTADLLDQFPDGAWFVELAALTDPDLIPQTILSAIRIPEQPGITVQQLLLDHLREKKLLLVLDNCEHLIGASAKLVESLVSNALELKVLTTSREALGIQGELVRQVPSLSLPIIKRFPAIEQFCQFEAVQLFIERALLVRADFVVTNGNAPHIAQICSRLDGIPLAIELAAARVRAMSVDQISKRLDDRFRLLTGGNRSALERQQTLIATLDWSYNLLSNAEKLLLCRLSVFVSGWTLEAAEHACGDEESDFDVLDLLTRLIEKSLVILDGSRYHMLETTRQYSVGKLSVSRESERMQDKHLAYFLQFAKNAEPQLMGPDQAEWLNRLEKEHDNFRSALRWCMESGKGEEAAQMAGALGMFWFKHCHYSEGRRFIADIFDRAWSISDRSQAKAWSIAGDLAYWQQDVVEARRILTENLEREQKLGDQSRIAYSLHKLGNVAFAEGDMEQALALNKKSIALSREIDATWVLAMAQISLGYMEHVLGNLPRAEELYEESLRHCRQLGEKWGMALILGNLGMIFYSRGDLPAAKRTFLEGLDITYELSNIEGTIVVLAGIVKIFQEEGEQIISARLQGMVAAKERELGISLYAVEQDMFDSAANALKGSMGEQLYQAEFETGMLLTVEDALNLVHNRIRS